MNALAFGPNLQFSRLSASPDATLHLGICSCIHANVIPLQIRLRNSFVDHGTLLKLSFTMKIDSGVLQETLT